MVSSTPRLLFTHRKDPVPIVQEAEWAPGPVWTGGRSRRHRDSIPDRPACSQSLYRLSYRGHNVFVLYSILFIHSSSSSSSSSSSIGTTAHCGLWPVEQCPSILSYLPPTLSIFSFPALEDLFLIPLSIFSWVFPFFSSLPVLE